MALQSFDGPWPLLQFRNHFYRDGKTPWTRDQLVARPLPTHENTYTDIHVFSRIRTHDPSVRASEDGSCLIPLVQCDRRLSVYNPETNRKPLNKVFHVSSITGNSGEAVGMFPFWSQFGTSHGLWAKISVSFWIVSRQGSAQTKLVQKDEKHISCPILSCASLTDFRVI
jgi:hypothetical protein